MRDSTLARTNVASRVFTRVSDPVAAGLVASPSRPGGNVTGMADLTAELASKQLELLTEFQILPEDLDQLDSDRFGVIERKGKKLYRYRAKDYRIYFAKTDKGIKVHRVLHKNTFRDFLFRSKLPISEDAQLGETHEFWKLIEEGEKTRKAL